MSWSLELRNGDLTIGGARLGMVTGGQKLVQDLRCALLERMGTDPSHPSYGSLIDGGRTSDGVEHAGVLGESNWDHIAMQVEAELRRITSDYQNSQVQRASADRTTYGKSTLGASEVLLGVTSIDLIQVQDTLVAHVVLQVGDGESRSLNIPLSSEPVITG